MGSEREHLSVYPVEVLCLVVLMLGMSQADKQGFPRAVVGFKSVVVGRFFFLLLLTRGFISFVCHVCVISRSVGVCQEIRREPFTSLIPLKRQYTLKNPSSSRITIDIDILQKRLKCPRTEVIL